MASFYRGLYLLYLARQGYWTDDEEAGFRPFAFYLAPFVLSALGIGLVLPFVKEQVSAFLAGQDFYGLLSYETIAVGLMLLIVSAGPAYENYFVLTGKTLETFSLFFGIKGARLHVLLLVKNTLLILPILVLSFFVQSWLVWGFFLVSHGLSLRALSFYLAHPLRLPRLSGHLAYWLSVIDGVSFVKLLVKPILSLILFLVIYQVYPAYFSTSIDHPFLVALLIGLVAYQSKGLAYYFLVLVKDLPYLKISGLRVEGWLYRQLVFLLSLGFLPGLLVTLIFTLVNGMSGQSALLFTSGIGLAFVTCQGQHIKASLRLKDRGLLTVGQVDSQPLPLTERLRYWREQGPLLLIVPLAWVFRAYPGWYSLALVLFLLVFVYRQVTSSLSDYLYKEDGQ